MDQDLDPGGQKTYGTAGGERSTAAADPSSALSGTDGLQQQQKWLHQSNLKNDGKSSVADP
jgi:hypothetical protein